jgi:hypothetical protein
MCRSSLATAERSGVPRRLLRQDGQVTATLRYFDQGSRRLVERPVDTEADVRAAVDAATDFRTGRGTSIVEVQRGDGSSVTCNADSDRAYLIWIDPLGQSVHSAGGEPGAPWVHDHLGNWSKVPSEYAVSASMGLEVLVRFVADGAIQDYRWMSDAGSDDVPFHNWAPWRGDIFRGYKSLAEAQNDPDASVVLAGDYGGTIFLTVPLRLVACDTETLRVLVSDLDAVTWMSGDPTIATVSFEPNPVGTRAPGGNGGGPVVDGVWTNPTMLPRIVREQASEVVLGARPRIDGTILRECRQRELERKKQLREAQPEIRTRHYPDGIPWDFDIHPPERDLTN